MKKHLLLLAAVLIALVSAATTTSRSASGNGFGRNNSNICVPGPVIESNCDETLLTGPQCHVMIGGQSKLAYSEASCSFALRKLP